MTIWFTCLFRIIRCLKGTALYKILFVGNPSSELGSTPSPICHCEPKIAKTSSQTQESEELSSSVLDWGLWCQRVERCRVWVLLVGTYKGPPVAWESSVVSHGQDGDKGESSWCLVPAMTDSCMMMVQMISLHGIMVPWCIWCILAWESSVVSHGQDGDEGERCGSCLVHGLLAHSEWHLYDLWCIW